MCERVCVCVFASVRHWGRNILGFFCFPIGAGQKKKRDCTNVDMRGEDPDTDIDQMDGIPTKDTTMLGKSNCLPGSSKS